LAIVRASCKAFWRQLPVLFRVRAGCVAVGVIGMIPLIIPGTVAYTRVSGIGQGANGVLPTRVASIFICALNVAARSRWCGRASVLGLI
jgi:hypothetical protein